MRVAGGPVRVRRFPIIRAEMGLRERHQHAGVVRRAQDFGETQMRAWFATVIVRIDKVDAEALEAQQALLRRRVGRRRGPDLRVVEGHQGQVKPRAVEVEVAALNPEFAETERCGRRRVH